MTRFFSALEDDRGSEACAELSRPARQALEGQAGEACGEACGEAIIELELDTGAVTSTAVFATNAKVDLSTGDSAFLSREAEGWKLSAVGCKLPEKGKPRDRPFDCELEA